jgi:hypothetical protein
MNYPRILSICVISTFQFILIGNTEAQMTPGTTVSGSTPNWTLNLEQLGAGSTLNLVSKQGNFISGWSFTGPPLNTRARRFGILSNGDAFFTGELRVDSFSQSSNGEFNVDAPGIVGGRLKVSKDGHIGIGSFRTNARLYVQGAAEYGVQAESSGDISYAAVHGSNIGKGYGVLGTSEEGPGISGISNKGLAARIASRDGDLLQGFNRSNTPVFRVANDGTTTTKAVQISGGADLSENFHVSVAKTIAYSKESIQPGLVVVIDAQNEGNLTLSHLQYDNRVAGVISGAHGLEPGVVLNKVSQGLGSYQYPIALAGKVYCWADASENPIEPGDLLTTSNRVGHAMRVNDFDKAKGAILGKAMTRLTKGTGLILMLVTLQ